MKNIIISRTDSIGDVVLTLPLAGVLKKEFPDSKLIFIAAPYTIPIVKRSKFIDKVLSKDELSDYKIEGKDSAIIFVFPDKDVAKWAKSNGIDKRIGTSHRLIHWLYANKRVSFSRKNSDLHEAQLNFKLLGPLGIENIPGKEELSSYYGFAKPDPKPDNARINIIIHPKSKGSAREWPLKHYKSLTENFRDSNIDFHVTGTEKERELIIKEDPDFFSGENIKDQTGKMTLDELIDFISQSDGLIAASTGPLHIAAAYGIPCLGLYPSRKPMHPGRWSPIGRNASFLEDGTDQKIGWLDISPSLVEKWIRETILKQ